MEEKPRAFIASSGESLDIAYAIQELLEKDIEATVWSQGVFDLTHYALESLLQILDSHQYLICVLGSDDVLISRGEKKLTARDNVIFELGLFMGRYGRDHCSIIQPSNIDLHLPSDISGVNVAGYNPQRNDNNLLAALGPASNRIRKHVKQVIPEDTAKEKKVRYVAAIPYRVINSEIEILLVQTAGGRWTPPKGKRIPSENNVSAVLRLARTKGGVDGYVDSSEICFFSHLKASSDQRLNIAAFLVEFSQNVKSHQGFRKPKWFSPDEAKQKLSENRGVFYVEEFKKVIDLAVDRVGG